MMKKRIGIVEDNPAFLDYVCGVFNDKDAYEVTAIARTYTEGLQLFKSNALDIVFLDLGLPDGDGLDLILKAQRLSPTPCIYVLSAFDDADRICKALQYGAKGYLYKDEPAPMLLAAFESLLAGGVSLSPLVSMKIVDIFNASAASRALLTECEFKIFEKLVRGNKPKEIANELNVSVSTINSHVKNVYKKLNVNSLSGALNVLKL